MTIAQETFKEFSCTDQNANKTKARNQRKDALRQEIAVQTRFERPVSPSGQNRAFESEGEYFGGAHLLSSSMTLPVLL